MSQPVFIQNASALDLQVEGTVGNFKVKNTDKDSIEVKYILSHVSLDTTGSHQEKLLSKLTPVREVFDFKMLDFDQIMQRDIDDSRISLDLIHYLLENGKSGLVKLFPPIVVAVVPIQEGSKKPDDFYPDVNLLSNEKNGDFFYDRIRSGSVGKEAFEFEQLILNGVASDHNYAKLKLNTSKVELVIVDGQHRAMALLALYRNLKGWPDKASAYETYYRNWEASKIREYDLTDLKLPIMICVFPTVFKNAGTDITIPKACRSIFLALNKNAKPVTRARNILLDDRNLISEFLRSILSSVKDTDESQTDMRLFNFQLDSSSDNAASLSSAVAYSSVMHLNNLLERLLLLPTSVEKFKNVDVNFGIYKKLNYLLQEKRLNGESILTSDVIEALRRDNYSYEVKNKLVDEFVRRYGKNIVSGFNDFLPFKHHSKAANKLYLNLEGKRERQCVSIFFDNQGVEKVFTDYKDRIDEKYSELRLLKSDSLPEGLKTVKEIFDSTSKRIEEYEKEFERDRAIEFFSISSSSKISSSLVKILNDIYNFNFKTSAFQSALFLAFFTVIEKLDGPRLSNDEINSLFNEYINSLNKFFIAEKKSDMIKVVKVFMGKYKGTFDSEDMTIVENSLSLRSVLIPGELNPSEWVKFRYIFLELWKTNNSRINELIIKEIKECREALYSQYFNQLRREKAKELKIDLEELEKSQNHKLHQLAVGDILKAVNELELNYQISENDLPASKFVE